jgi:hypothetical protein
VERLVIAVQSVSTAVERLVIAVQSVSTAVERLVIAVQSVSTAVERLVIAIQSVSTAVERLVIAVTAGPGSGAGHRRKILCNETAPHPAHRHRRDDRGTSPRARGEVSRHDPRDPLVPEGPSFGGGAPTQKGSKYDVQYHHDREAYPGGDLGAAQALASGLQQQLPGGQFTLVSTDYTTATLVQALQGLISALTAVGSAHASVKQALTAYGAEDTKMGPIVSALKRVLRAMYADSPATPALFGLKPPKARAPLTSTQLAAKVAKAAATRKARGTMSKKQKASISGNVTGVTITANVAPAPVPESAAPQAALAAEGQGPEQSLPARAR